MNPTSNPKLTAISKVLRRRMTNEEKHLWYDFLKKIPQTVHRQKVIGEYIVDFYCAEAKLIIELDGSQHYDEAGKQKDIKRDQYFQTLGLTVLRYSNFDIHQHFENICADIQLHISTSSVS